MTSNELIKHANAVALRDSCTVPAEYVSDVFRQQISDLQKVAQTYDGRRRILLLGGGGYVGTVVAGHLLASGYAVRCLDPFVYGNDQAITHLLNDPGFDYRRGDMGDEATLDAALDRVSDVVILGGLVGDPITKTYPEQSAEINEGAVSRAINRLTTRDTLRRVIFVSTCSNYGLVENEELADEATKLQPLSLYAKAKVAMEQQVLAMKGKTAFEATVLRFATAFGLSPRMRFDLTVSQFARELALGRELVVFDPDTWRPYCHVSDFATLIRRVIEAPTERIDYEVFNAGGNANNSTKRNLVEIIQKSIPDTHVVIQTEGPDPRNYKVDFGKVVNALHFVPDWTVEDGVRQVISAVQSGLFQGSDEHYGNYTLIEPWAQGTQ
ncbi:MAG: NAD-dependent epimerase/dehydratase family protein [Hyphomicrobiales bacterium]